MCFFFFFFWGGGGEQSKKLVNNVIATILSNCLHNSCFHFSGSLSIEVSNPREKGATDQVLKMRCFSSVTERQRFMFAFIGKRHVCKNLVLSNELIKVELPP